MDCVVRDENGECSLFRIYKAVHSLAHDRDTRHPRLSMTTLSYPVIVREIGTTIGAQVPDLWCQVVGGNRAEAITNAKRAAQAVLDDCKAKAGAPPRPSRFAIVYIDFPDYLGPNANLHLR